MEHAALTASLKLSGRPICITDREVLLAGRETSNSRLAAGGPNKIEADVGQEM